MVLIRDVQTAAGRPGGAEPEHSFQDEVRYVIRTLKRTREWRLLLFEFVTYAARNAEFRQRFAAGRQNIKAALAAEAEALGLRHNHVGTEHLLLGLLGVGDGVTAKVLTRMGVSAAAARAETEQIIGRGSEPSGGQPPFTPRSKRLLDLAHGEANRLGHHYVGTEHLLLGLVREGAGVAAQILDRLGADRAAIVEALMQVLGADPVDRKQRGAFLTGEFTAVLDENDQLHAEIERLRLLLRQHGVEPDDGATRSA